MPRPIDESLREAIAKSGLSAGQLALRAGIPQQTISEFLRGRDMRLSRAQKLAAYFNLELREVKPKKKD